MKSSEANSKVFIIILNWNNKNDTLETIESLKKLTYDNYEIIIVDNCSTDGSSVAVKNIYPEVVLIENEENLGYAEGNNVGIRYALDMKADFIFILNNDITADPELLSVLIAEMEKNKSVGIAGPKTYFYLNSNIIQSAGGVIDKNYNSLHIGRNELDKGQYEDTNEVDFMTGSAILIKREVFESIGLIDPRYFMYWEETDFCYRAKKAGFKCVIVPKAKIWHKGGVNSTPLITYYMSRNRLLFIKKNKLGYINLIRTYIEIIKTILSWTIKPRWKNKKEERNMLLKALYDFTRGKYERI